MSINYREIPYNYTSLSDKEIILKYLDRQTWETIDELRRHRITGRSAKALFEIYGDIFIIDRNPYIANDFLDKPHKLRRLKRLHRRRLKTIAAVTDNAHGELEVFKKTADLVAVFFKNLEQTRKRRKRISAVLGTVTAKGNFKFDGFHRVSHCTDATDWRMEYPEVVVYPDSREEVERLVEAANRLGLKVVPRGGGTGLTGGAVPASADTMVVNLEKLQRMGPIEVVQIGDKAVPIIALEAGVVTERAMSHCAQHGYVFATDPTSAWAATIGGNIAENAGGKKCVMWGTCIDNLYSLDMVISGAKTIRVQRHRHPYRKIEPDEEVVFDIFEVPQNGPWEKLRSIRLKGTDIRKRGLGKDITNKALGGVPGIQKEGADGIIVEARFVLYRPFEVAKTVCLEFYGNTMSAASEAIVAIRDAFDKNDDVFLTALEHIDDKYLAAIGYINKSDRSELPKAVLLIDVEGNSPDRLRAACANLERLVKDGHAEVFIADTAVQRERFWAERKNLGAIARHTNAFKINEDIVIPIEKLPEFTDFVDQLNVEKQLECSIAIARAAEQCVEIISKKLPPELNRERVDQYRSLVVSFTRQCERYLEHLDAPASSVVERDGAATDATVFELIRQSEIVISTDASVVEPFYHLARGHEVLRAQFDRMIETERQRQIIIATHMHAGDGNNHVNIPVHSNDYAMMRDADLTAHRVMRETVRLGGVVSGEHGIGITKLKFLEPEKIAEFAEYKSEVDPDDLFNPGKLRADFPYERVYTPSFNLLELEAFVLTSTDLHELLEAISGCVRCGKCKAVCNTHYPDGTMFYNPRNKNLGLGLIIEAVLYDTLTANRLSFRNFKKLTEIADHCTMCHKCETPCPVNIDFGQVTLKTKELLVSRKKSTFRPMTAVAYGFMGLKSFRLNRLARRLLFRLGYATQRAAHEMSRPIHGLLKRRTATLGPLLEGRFPKAGERTLRERLKLRDRRTITAFSNPDLEIKKTVFYFPGCGSERMFANISMATLALLYENGIRVVIPPEYMCCGYPAVAAGKQGRANLISSGNQVLFHKIAGLLGYLKIDAVIVTCGTCMEMLEKSGIANIFSGAELIDVNAFLVQQRLLPTLERGPVFYHDPCHSPLKDVGCERVIEALLGNAPTVVPNCCGDGGTLALSTPHISSALRTRKKRNIERMAQDARIEVLTTCPSCVQGLSKIDDGLDVRGKSLVVSLAEHHLGKKWKRQFIRKLKSRPESLDRTLL